MEVPQRKGDPLVVDTDEGVRAETTAESLSKLRPAFDKAGTITAGNATNRPVSNIRPPQIATDSRKSLSMFCTPIGRVWKLFANAPSNSR